MLSWEQIQSNAMAFSKRWKDGGNEKQEAQSFVRALLCVFGVDDSVIDSGFENAVRIGGHDKYIDFLWQGHIAIEMKSKGKDLDTAFKQLQNYMEHLTNPDDVPDLWLVCDFENIHLTRRSTKQTFKFKTKDLRKHIKKFADIAGHSTERIRADQLELNVKAAEKMAKLHDELKAIGYDGNDLEMYLVRLLFCMFAGDTGIFPKGSFYHYINDSKADGSNLSYRISDLFEVLNMDENARKKRTLLSDELKQFRYINGGLFEKLLPKADFNAKMRKLLMECREFDWSEISPAIFGAMFQGVMDKTQRRELGAHYTSEENILKLINPLFLDELYKEFERVKTDPIALDRFHDKIARLRFLDPACGCGNFLIITYRELRMLELEIIKMKQDTNQLRIDMGMEGFLKVSVTQFYGIEYEDFPCQIAIVGMWLVDHQMNLLASELIGQYYARLPLTESATIVHGNALRIDWGNVVSKHELSYILGNPPFVGFTYQSNEQKEDVSLLTKSKNLDYVAMWYIKAAQYMINTAIRCGFVSTNSIVQGEQVTALWKPLIDNGVYINFGIPTFKWSNEAKGKAAVHCVIVGFSYNKTEPNINPYLLEAPIVFLERRSKPICDVPEMIAGGKPTDGGHLILSEDEYNSFISTEPNAIKYIRRYYMGNDFINNIKRYCIWLVDCPPSELRKMQYVMERVEQVRQMRLNSKKPATQAKAETPMLFDEIRNINSENYVAVPKVSSERRKYIPIGFLASDNVAGDKLFIVSGMGLYGFGILTSIVHMAWMRVVCGRLKSDYSYSNTIVYNNFPWADVTNNQQAEIEKLAQAVLNARAASSDCSLADLYDPLTMPPELLKAHKALDRAVMRLYGFAGLDEAGVVSGLMERYKNLISGGLEK